MVSIERYKEAVNEMTLVLAECFDSMLEELLKWEILNSDVIIVEKF